MKTKRLLLSSACLILAAVLLLFGCDSNKEPQTFTADGISLTLTDDFSEVQSDYAYACYQSYSIFVIVEKFSFDELGHTDLTSSSTIEDFSEYVVKDYPFSDNAQFLSSDSGKYIYGTYVREIDDDNYKFYACLYKSDEAFWIVNFCCTEVYTDGYEEDIFSWADSVEFGEDFTAPPTTTTEET